MDWKQEAVDKLRKFTVMCCSLDTIPMELKRLETDARSIQAADPGTVARRGGHGALEDRLVENLMLRQELTRSLRQAKSWVAATGKGLEALDPEERALLENLYICREKRSIFDLCEEMGLEQSSLYRRRDKALYRFTLAMYGALES